MAQPFYLRFSITFGVAFNRATSAQSAAFSVASWLTQYHNIDVAQWTTSDTNLNFGLRGFVIIKALTLTGAINTLMRILRHHSRPVVMPQELPAPRLHIGPSNARAYWDWVRRSRGRGLGDASYRRNSLFRY